MGKDEKPRKDDDPLEDDIFTQYEFEEKDGKDENEEDGDVESKEKK